MIIQEDTIVAQSTPVGEGAIGVIRLSGPESKNILQRIFIGKKRVEQFKSHQLYLGRLVDPKSNEPMDQVLVVWMKKPNTFTGEEMVEIHAHGGPLILCRILEWITNHGARLAEPGEFSKRSFLNGKIDLSQAEAIADLIAAKNEWAAKNALSQLDGTLSGMIDRFKRGVIELLASIEAGFDFSEEDIQIFNKEEGVKALRKINKEINRLLDSFQTGQLYKQGLRIAIVGKPNVGKSSLLNELLLEERAITHEEPGTTRDVVCGERRINGINTIIYDTAGIRESGGPVEKEGIRKTKDIIDKSDLILHVLDSSRDFDHEDFAITEILSLKTTIYVYNKIDLASKWDPEKELKEKIIRISTQNKEGISQLLDEIDKKILNKRLNKDHNYVLNNVRHKNQLEKCRIKINWIIDEILNNRLKEECLVEELRIIIRHLDEITGGIDREEILDEIFSKFCIGK